MKQAVARPPNYDTIAAVLNPPDDAVFCYGDTIYNPSGKELSPDIIRHEEVHMTQQGDDPGSWYRQYLMDPDFRFKAELEAYGLQYAFAVYNISAESDRQRAEGKRLIVSKTQLLEYALDSMARALSGEGYGNLISYAEARSKIRNFARSIDI